MNESTKAFLPDVTLSFRLKQSTFQCLAISNQTATLTGYTTQELLACTPRFDSLFHPDDADICQAMFSHTEQQKPISLTFRIIQQNNEPKILRASYTKQHNPDKQETNIQISLQLPSPPAIDIFSQSALTNFIEMLENTNDYIYFKDRNHVFTGASQTLVGITNPTELWTDLIGKTDYDVFPREFADIYYTLEKRVFSGEISVAQEIQPMLDVDGNAGWVDNRKYPIYDKAGNITGLFGIARDITELKKLQDRLAESAENLLLSTQHLKLYREQAPLATIEWNVDFEILEWNKEAAKMFGYTLEEVKGRYFVDFMLPDTVIVDIKQLWKDLISETGGTSSINENITKDGRTILCEWHNTVIKDNTGKVVGAASIILDITERKRVEDEIKLAASVFSHTREGITITDAKGTIIDVNETFTQTTGYSREEAIGQNSRILKSGRQSPEFYADMWQALLEEGYWNGEVWNRRKNGEVFAEMKTISAVRDQQGITTHYVALGSDITPMKKHQEQLEYIAQYDILTNLPNRSLLADRLSQAMLQCSRQQQSLAVVFLDLDHFKEVNDDHGHDVGDKLLIALSLRMKEALREGDTLARIGGDEFVAVLANIEDCEPVLERLLVAASKPICVGDIVLNVSASIGVTLYPQDDVDADQLMRHADQAMYVAKESGKNRYHLFNTDQDDAMKLKRKSLEAIRNALDHQQFVLHYQPKVNMKSGTVTGVEALVRWQHPQRGLLNPIEFLPVIENHAMIIEMGEWVIDTALTQMSQWDNMGLNLPISTSVNIAALQLQQSDFTDRLTSLLAAHPDVDPRYLELEVLETSALDDVTHVSEIMNACMALGVNFSLDDFGTGYSSLTYLKRLPARLIKIDQSFVRDMLNDPDDLAIVEAVIALAKSFKRDVIAEGVETIEHGTTLLKMGCDLAQGYGIARPMPASDIPAWVGEWKPDAAWQR